MSQKPQSQLGGIRFGTGSFEENSASVCGWLRGRRQRQFIVSYVNPHVFNIARKNSTVRDFLNHADLVTVDGIGIVLAALVLKRKRATRTVMTPLFDRVIATNDLPHVSALLIGGTGPEAKQAAATINQSSPNVQVTASYDGFLKISDYLNLFRQHTEAGAVLVGMGSPRSEQLLLAAKDLCPGKLLWNIGGGTIQYYAGTKRRVPKMVSVLGVQWIYRMLREPRTVRRYAIGIPEFFWNLLKIVCIEGEVA